MKATGTNISTMLAKVGRWDLDVRRAGHARAKPSDSDRQVGSFYSVTHNPVRVEIAQLRELRDAGMLSAADYAVRVSALINGHAVPSSY